VIGFRFLLIYANGEPVDPAMFICAEARWSVGDVFTLGPGREFRILDVQPPSAEGAMLEPPVTRGTSGTTRSEEAGLTLGLFASRAPDRGLHSDGRPKTPAAQDAP
jgi:hypothetical protein